MRSAAETTVAMVTVTHFFLLLFLVAVATVAAACGAVFVSGNTVVEPKSLATGELVGLFEIGNPAIALSISKRISAAVWYLLAGDFVNAVIVIASSVVGIEGSIDDGSFGASFTC